ncbi:hypothetical protein F0U62_34305 [Cystobacter fuscus]|uniref:hypothetical protein n=1 Tax=Cystobacter fuscus TaxID=43 RepID=UPI002B2C16EC|nr:hypothetical protein F0U62_34305 [Cystobacter fuscus]
MAIIFMSMLVGCVTVSGERTSSAWIQMDPWAKQQRTSVPPSKALLAMSDGPAAGGDPPSPTFQGYNVPGRDPNSQMPWELFLGNASHRMIAFMYKINHPDIRAYYNTKSIKAILEEAGIGDTSRLLPGERKICPDITDITSRRLFEIKPWGEQGLQEGREMARTYLAALNRAILMGSRFTGGTDFHGEILIRFAQGQYIWRLEWRTTEPGVIQYRWTRSQERFDSEVAAYDAGHWVDLTEQELRQYGGWVAQSTEGMIGRREHLATVSEAVGIVIDVVGEVATAVFSSAILGQMRQGTGTQQPPAQRGGQVIPFPARPPTTPPTRLPAAGMSLPQ